MSPSPDRRGRRVMSAIGSLLAVLAACSAQPVPALSMLRRKAPEVCNVTAQLRVSADPGKTQPAAIALQWQDDANHLLLELTTTKLKLSAVSGGESRTVAETAPRSIALTGTHTLLIKQRAQTISVFLDGKKIAETPTPNEAARGRVGHTGEQAAVAISDVRAQPIMPIHAKDDFARVGDEQGIWQPATGEWAVAAVSSAASFSTNAFCLLVKGQDAVTLAGYWFWENHRYAIAVRKHVGTSTVGLVFHADDARNHMQFRWQNGELQLVEVSDGREHIHAKTPCALTDEQWVELAVCTLGDHVLCTFDRQPAFKPVNLGREHGRIGLIVSGPDGAHFDDMRIVSVDRLEPEPLAPRVPVVKDSFANDKYMKKWTEDAADADGNVLDYTFHAAPADWAVQHGTWGLQTRWACNPRWTWFGGSSRQSAIIWHKHEFAGDLSVDLYAAFRMDSPFGPPYRRPADINISFCADGTDLNSGYTLVFAGWNNHWTRLLRGDEVVAETSSVLLADNRNTFQRAVIHYSWYHVRVEKRGSTVRCLVNDKPVLSYDDPRPLDGRRLALWTWDNQLMVARTRVEADSISAGPLPQRPLWANETDRNAAGSGKAALACAAPGAPLETDIASLRGADLNDNCFLSFRYAAPAGMLLNLYIQTQDQLHAVGFSAAEITHDDVPLVGTFPKPQLDDKWHAARIDLKACFRQTYPETKDLRIQRAFFGLVSDDPYVLCGYRGNRTGMTAAFDQIAVSGKPASAGTAAATAVVRRQLTPVEPTQGALCYDTFESDVGQWCNYGGRKGATLSRDRWHSASGQFSLKVVNAELGGTFGAFARQTPYNPRRFPIVSFDYRASLDLRLDLRVVLDNGEQRTIRFTDYDYTWPAIGQITPVTRDRQWQHAEFDLLAMLREHDLGDRCVTALLFASGGYPGNGEGLTYHIDNFAILPRPGAAPLADTTAPTVTSVTPGPGAPADGETVTVRLADTGSGLDPASIRLICRDKIYHIGMPAVTFDPKTGLLTLTARRVRPDGCSFGNAEKVRCRCSASDMAGNRMPVYTWEWVADFRQDKTPPPPPYVTYIPTDRLVRYAFEENADDWGFWVNCQVTATAETSATGQGCIALTSLHRSSTNAWALGNIPHIPLDKYPYASLDFRLSEAHLGEQPRFTLMKLYFDGKRDRYTSINSGSYDGDDQQWQHIEADLRHPSPTKATDPFGLVLATSIRRSVEGEDGKTKSVTIGRPGTQVFVDNVVVYSRDDPTPSFEWSTPPDATGIAGYSWTFDQSETTDPPQEVRGKEPRTQLTGVTPGIWWFHVRAVDRAGNWSETGRRRVVIGNATAVASRYSRYRKK